MTDTLYPEPSGAFRREHQKLLQQLHLSGGEAIRDVEHFRVPYWRVTDAPEGGHIGYWIGSDTPVGWVTAIRHGYQHVAVVVMATGRCYVGIAAPNYRDQYDRKRGYVVAVGKALRNAVLDSASCVSFVDERGLTGRALRDFCRDALGIKEGYRDDQ